MNKTLFYSALKALDVHLTQLTLCKVVAHHLQKLAVNDSVIILSTSSAQDYYPGNKIDRNQRKMLLQDHY